jgi:hypothetical protein
LGKAGTFPCSLREAALGGGMSGRAAPARARAPERQVRNGWHRYQTGAQGQQGAPILRRGCAFPLRRGCALWGPSSLPLGQPEQPAA